MMLDKSMTPPIGPTSLGGVRGPPTGQCRGQVQSLEGRAGGDREELQEK